MVRQVMLVPGLDVRFAESGDSEIVDGDGLPVTDDGMTVVSVIEWFNFLKNLSAHPAFTHVFTDEFKQS